MLVEEDTTWDSETTHTSEVVSYVAIQGDGTLTAVRRQTIIQRTTYRLAGQAIAVKVSGSPADDGLYYVHSDHLGSASVLSNAGGGLVPGSEARYLPFGGWRTQPTSNPGLTDMGFTGHKHNNSSSHDLGLIYMNARYYVPYINRFVSADSIVPDPTNPQQFNRYSYALNNALKYTDPSGHIACNDPHLPEGEGRCREDGSWGPGVIVYYLNGLGGRPNIVPQNVPETLDEYSYTLYVLEGLYGKESVHHIPVFTEEFRRGYSQLAMIAEAIGSAKPQTHKALQEILANPPYPGEKVVLVGSSAGGTVAIELLTMLQGEGLFVDHVILRGSPVIELSLVNVGRVDYLAGDPPNSDNYYSIDINPFDAVKVQEHIVPGLTQHAPNRTSDPAQVLKKIGSLIVDLLTD